MFEGERERERERDKERERRERDNKRDSVCVCREREKSSVRYYREYVDCRKGSDKCILREREREAMRERECVCVSRERKIISKVSPRICRLGRGSDILREREIKKREIETMRETSSAFLRHEKSNSGRYLI